MLPVLKPHSDCSTWCTELGGSLSWIVSLTWHWEGLFSPSCNRSSWTYSLNSSWDLKVLFEGVVMIQWYARKKGKGSEQRILICNILVLFLQIRSIWRLSSLCCSRWLTSKCFSMKEERRQLALEPAVGKSRCTKAVFLMIQLGIPCRWFIVTSLARSSS